ncbi:MFS transporter [Microbacterium sp. KUDC0406]|uniref:MFS transporter n=1 Tax=Microbacterium sp. KUDC0406 TaxID=2909588 RepID=UPI001F3C4331|nr:MFS transporter [Microbacterium sp. KUDC0406]UJP08765.1 MFS transporter [Microbacterium sp. KUDC0406]
MSPGIRALGRPFTTFLVAETVSATGTMVTVVALPLIAIETLQASTFAIGLLEALQWLPAVFLGLLLGALVDRSQRRCRSVLVSADIGRAVTLGALPLAAHLGLLTLPVLLVSALLTGAFTAMFHSAYTPYLRQLVPSDRYAAASASMQAGRSSARIIGPALGGALVALIGASNTLILDAVSFLLCALALLTIVGRVDPPQPSPRRRLAREIGEGLRVLRTSTVLAWITGGAATANLLLSASGTLEILFLARDASLSSDLIGAVLTAGGLGGLTAALISRRLIDRYGVGRTGTSAFLYTAPASLLLPATQAGPSVLLFAVGIFVLSFGITLGSVAVMTLRLQHTPLELQGRVSAFSQVLNAATIPLGALLAGVLGQSVGTRAALVVLGCCYIAFGVAFSRSPVRSAAPQPVLKG